MVYGSRRAMSSSASMPRTARLPGPLRRDRAVVAVAVVECGVDEAVTGASLTPGPSCWRSHPTGQLTVLEPSAKEFKQLAKYKVSDSATYAYPIVAGNRVYVKDSDSLILWTIE